LITKDKLVVIRNTFSVHHMYSVAIEKPHPKVEIGHFDGVIFILNDATCVAYEPEHPGPALSWLHKAVFGPKKTIEFVCAKDAHVHVMVALETLINVAA
jgi:hypothetical protein